MKVSQFQKECETLPYSQIYFNLYKESTELDIIESYMESAYFQEAPVEQQKEIKQEAQEKQQGFFSNIWSKIKSLFIRFWNWVKSFFVKKKVENHIQQAQESIEDSLARQKKELEELIKQQELPEEEQEKAKKIADEVLKQREEEILKQAFGKAAENPVVKQAAENIPSGEVKTESTTSQNNTTPAPEKEEPPEQEKPELSPEQKAMIKKSDHIKRIRGELKRVYTGKIPKWILDFFLSMNFRTNTRKENDNTVLSLIFVRRDVAKEEYQKYASTINRIREGMKELRKYVEWSKEGVISKTSCHQEEILRNRLFDWPNTIDLTNTYEHTLQEIQKEIEEMQKGFDPNDEKNSKEFREALLHSFELFTKVILTTISFYNEIFNSINICAQHIYKFFLLNHSLDEETKRMVIQKIRGK